MKAETEERLREETRGEKKQGGGLGEKLRHVLERHVFHRRRAAAQAKPTKRAKGPCSGPRPMIIPPIITVRGRSIQE